MGGWIGHRLQETQSPSVGHSDGFGFCAGVSYLLGVGFDVNVVVTLTSGDLSHRHPFGGSGSLAKA
jgi:hypothetical protein